MILREDRKIMLSEKAKSRAQQRFFGMVRSAQKGEMKNPSSEVSQTASSMSKSDVKKMASTKHKGLPEKKDIQERLGGKGYKSYTSLTGKKVSGDWEDSDRGAGNKATRRAGGTVKAKSPTYIAHVVNKGKKKVDPKKNPVVNEAKKVEEKSKGRHPRDQKELDRAVAYIKKNPNFGKVSEAKEEQGRFDYGKASVRNKRKFGKEGEPAVFDASGERGKMIDQRRAEHKAKRGVKEGVMDVVKRYRNKHDEKKPQKAQDAGAKARRSLQRREYASKVSGSTENVPDNLRDHKTWGEFKKHI